MLFVLFTFFSRMWRTKEKGERIEKHTIVGAKAESPTNGLAIEERRENGIDREEERERERERVLYGEEITMSTAMAARYRGTREICAATMIKEKVFRRRVSR